MMHFTRRRFLQAGAGSALAAALGCAGPRAARPEEDAADLIARQASPLNAEPPLARLVESWVTPLRSFYVRRHGNAPRIEPGAYALRVTGLVERPLTLRLDDLEREPDTGVVTAVLQCAGNRRSEHGRIKKVGGVQWDAGAIGNAAWSGVRLSSILRKAGLKGEARWISFHSLDTCAFPGGSSEYGASIPVEKALAPETLLATAMNGERLSVEHGFPVRSLVPGFVGARSVKWLGEIRVAGRPSDNFFQARDYKLFPPEVTAETATWETAEPLGTMVTNAAICSPMAGEKAAAGAVKVRGYALAATGTTLARVEVSADDGRTWTAARLDGRSAPFGWRLWEADVKAAPGAAVLAVRAADSSGAVQPERPPWNFKGYLYNGWHRVPIVVV